MRRVLKQMAMAEGALFVWIPFLLSCVFQASDNRHVCGDACDSNGGIKNPATDHIFSQIPITLPEGIDPKNINITSITIKTCTDVKEQLAQLNIQLQQTNLRNSHLDNEAFGLRREVRQLNLQLATCSATASAITGSYQIQLLNKLKQLLETFDSDTFLILKIIALTREVNTLQRKIKHAANATETSEIGVLQREQQEKINELNVKMQQVESSHPNSALILQIISLQNQIWDMEQVQLRRGETNLQPDKIILDLQGQLDRKLSELRAKGDADLAMLELISVHSKITVMQRLINVIIERSRVHAADYQRAWRQKAELLRKKILQLNREESNSELTKEILKLQAEVEHFRQLMMNAKKTTESQLKELRVILEEEKKQQANLQKHLEETEYAQSQLIMKFISIMKEMRELDDDEQHHTTSSQATTLQTVLQAKEKEFAKAQAEINELQRKLRLKSKECSGLEEIYEVVKTEIEQKIVELTRTRNSKAALILNVINLHSDLKTLRDLISTESDPDRLSELQRQLEEKQEELNSKTADMERLIPNPKIILTIIDLQNEIWDLQKKAANDTTGDDVKDLQDRVKGLITELDDNGDDNTKLMMQIILLQSQVEQLERQLPTTQVTQHTDDLTTKKFELQKYVNELNEKNQTIARLILTITDLQNQLRNLEKGEHNKGQTASAPITKLREQLKAKVEEHIRDQAEIKALQNKLNQTEAQCTGFEDKLKDLQTNLDAKMQELQSKTESVSSLALQVSTLTLQLEELKRQLHNTDSETKIKELQKLIDEKNNELAKKTEELKARSAQPQRLLQIIAIQTEIEKISYVAANDTDYAKIRALQDHLNNLVDGIQDENNENTKLMFKMLAYQDEIARLEKQEKSQTQAALERIKDLENELEDIRNQIEEKTLVLDSSDTRINNLTAQIMELHKKIKPLEDEILDIKETSAENVRELQNRLELITRQLQDSELRLQEADAKNFNLIMEIADLRTQLKKAQKKASKPAENSSELEQQLQTQQRVNKKLESANKELRKQLKAKVEEHIRDQAEIKALQNKLNQTEAQCTGFEDKLKDLQTNLDAKMQELQSKTESVSSLALQVSTLTLQLEELKRQLHNTDSETKIKELQKLIDEKNNELAKKTEELKARSAQPQRLLQIIAIQTEIEKISYVAANDTDYAKIRALQDHLNNLVDGIQDENNENTKLMFKMLAYQDEIARLEKQEKSQTQAALERIKDLENELEDIRNQIEEKTLVLDSSDTRINNLTAQIMELHKKIKPLEDEILDIKETSAENVRELQNRLELITRQLQDSELRLQEADAKNFNLIMEIADLRTQLKKAQKKASKPAENSSELEQQLQTQQRVNKKLESANKDLKEEVKELKMCCADDVTHCADLQRQLQQSQEDADRLQQQLRKKDANLKQLQQQLEEQIRENNGLQNEKNKLEDYVQDLQNRLSNVDDKTIHARQVTLDPNTAHPRIALSADNTRISTSEEIQNVPYNPGRFDVVLAVLGTTGFSTGRHYWEVSVAGKLCYHLGMASESAQRKGSITFSPENGFWTLVMNKQSQLKAADSKPFIIPIQTQPLTLGILLDYKKGQISFYDAGARSHIYSFVGQRFTDKIYPFVNFCAGDVESLTPIVLLPSGSVDWIK